MKKLLFFITLIGLGLHNTQAQNFAWAKRMGGTSYDHGYSIAVDATGNVYTTGYFQGTVDFDPGAGIVNLTSAGGNDIFVSKLDASGNLVWAKNMGGTGADVGNGIAIDASGNVYTTGYFKGTADFDPGAGIVNLTSAGLNDIFVSKLDASGNFLWAKRIGGTSGDDGWGITIDDLGDVYTTGHFYGTVDFDPGAGTVNLTWGGGNRDIFVSKLDASGNFVWAKNMGGNDDDLGISIAVDATGNVYTTGNFSGTVDFDPGVGIDTHTSVGSVDIFVSKLDVLGNFVWAKNMGGTNSSYGWDISVDASGNIYTTGTFSGTTDFDPETGIVNLTSAGNWDIFVSKLDASGNFVWAKTIGGISGDHGYSIAVDATGNVYTTGYFQGAVDFDPGVGIDTLTSVLGGIFVSKLDASGNFVWAKNMGGTSGGGYGSSIVVDATGNVYTTGNFSGTVDFDPGAGIDTLTSAGSVDIFVSKLSQCVNTIGTDVQTACDSLTWIDGNTYSTNTNTPTFVLINAAGCDSVVTLNLTINSNTSTDVVIACDSITWLDGITYITNTNTPTFTLTNAAGCDSVVTLNLTMNNPTSSTDVVTACDSITWIDGITYTANANTPTFTLTNSVGCDSIVTLNLTINNLTASYTSLDNSNGNYTFTNTSTGTFNQTHWAFGDGTTSTTTNPNHTFNANGTYVVVLTVNDSTSSSCMDYYLDTIVVTGVVAPLQCAAGFVMYPDAGGVTVVNSSTGTNLTYFWNFGDGNTSTQAYPTHTYATAGPYYLCLTIDDGNGCVDMYCDSIGENGVVFNKQAGFTINVVAPPIATSADYNIDLESEVEIYPNPTNKTLNIVLTEKQQMDLTIISIDGKLVESMTIIGNTSLDVSNYSKGMYFIKATNKDGKIFQSKFVKE